MDRSRLAEIRAGYNDGDHRSLVEEECVAALERVYAFMDDWCVGIAKEGKPNLVYTRLMMALAPPPAPHNRPVLDDRLADAKPQGETPEGLSGAGEGLDLDELEADVKLRRGGFALRDEVLALIARIRELEAAFKAYTPGFTETAGEPPTRIDEAGFPLTDCPACGGDGWDNVESWRRCRKCSGSGRVMGAKA